jgi:hypothetical protein
MHVTSGHISLAKASHIFRSNYKTVEVQFFDLGRDPDMIAKIENIWE